MLPTCAPISSRSLHTSDDGRKGELPAEQATTFGSQSQRLCGWHKRENIAKEA